MVMGKKYIVTLDGDMGSDQAEKFADGYWRERMSVQ